MKLTAKPVLAAVSLVFCALAGWAFQAARQTAAAPASMAAMLPQGALLTIESPDFAALLHSWNASPEEKAWLGSDNNRVFSNSRLFGRLSDARTEFEAAATPPKGESPSFDGDFLTQIAGKQSIFAWYDVGNLEFLYITRISSAQAANISLLKDRNGWTARQSAGVTFYLRKTVAAAPNAAEEQAESAQGKARTVAFAQAGGLLILATREDLIANALALIHPAANAQSVASEPWFTEASSALPAQTPSPGLHMVLNLARLTHLAYFRSYWVQGNISEMQQYRAAVSDLYMTPAQFREERALLPGKSDVEPAQADLASLAALVPANDGTFRAEATSDADAAVASLEEKLLGRIALVEVADKDAPDPLLDAPQSGSASDLEVRIDTPAPVSQAVSNRALSDALNASGLDAMLTYSAAQPPAIAAGLWVPIHSAVVLHARSGWNAQTLKTALQQSLRGSLTTGYLGVEFQAGTGGGQTVYSLNGPKTLFFSTDANLCILADDRGLLEAMLRQSTQAHPAAAPATLMAGFDHTSQRGPYARLTSLIDGTNHAQLAGATPAYFSGNLRSLSDSFASLRGENFVERRDGAVLRQTVTYDWRNP